MPFFLSAATISGGTDASVQVAILGRVGLDRDALLGDLDGMLAKVGLLGLFDCLQLDAVLIDHAFVMVGGEGRHALRQEIVVGVARTNFDHIALGS